VGKDLVPQGSSSLPQPNLLDRAISVVAPVTAAKRYRARVAMTMFSQLYGGGFASGRRDRNALKDYNPAGRSADADINPGLRRCGPAPATWS
jgi:hypothetical protein